MKKYSKILLMLAIFILVPAMCILTACKGNEEPKIVDIEAYHKNSIYDFKMGVEVTYDENLPFTANDFTVLLKYDDGSSKTIDSGFSFDIYKLGETETLVTNFLAGNYRLDFGYEGLSTGLFLTMSSSE